MAELLLFVILIVLLHIDWHPTRWRDDWKKQ